MMPDETRSPPPKVANDGPAVVVDATRLFGGAKEVQIDFQGVRYRLRITRRGKLILQK